MPESLFITGAHGYVGRHLLERIDPQKYASIALLVRNDYDRDAPGQPVYGDLTEPASYKQELRDCDTVVHLAALTGKQPQEEYFRVNAAGTAALVKACEANGVRRFLHVSTIAVKYPDVEHYYYAQSKQMAEDSVRTSGLRWTIVRPTMILGAKSPMLENLSKLALGSSVRVLGDGQAPVQPIFIDDLVALILHILDTDDFQNQVIEAGGAERVTIEELLLRIRRSRGVGPARVVHIPVRLARTAAGLLKGPVVAGQLTALVSDGTADTIVTGRAGVNEALKLSIEGEGFERLRAECRTFARYLIGREPGRRIEAKYEEFHRTHSAEVECAGFDGKLLAAATRGARWTRLADTYASRFAKDSVLRKKLALILALLESTEPAASAIDSPAARSRIGAWIGMAAAAVRYVVCLAASFVLFAPLQAVNGRQRAQ